MRAAHAAVALLMVCACQSAQREEPQPALLARADEASMQSIRDALAGAARSTRIELGPTDLERTSRISVLPHRPGPYEGRSLATPMTFVLMIHGERCFLMRESDGAEFDVAGLACRPAPQ